MLEIIKQLLQSWAVSWLTIQITKLERKLEAKRDKLNKKITPDSMASYNEDEDY